MSRVFQRAFENFTDSHSWRDMQVDGEIPADLRGTLYTTGPALFELLGDRYEHWFDGDGAVSAVRFEDGRAQSAARLIDTPALQEERRAGKMLFGGYHRRGALRMLLRSPMRRGKNTGNTAILVEDGRVFALWEGGRPIEVDPETLDTLGPCSFDGVLKGAFSAHPHYVAARDATYGFGLRVGRGPVLDVFETRLGTTRKLTSVPLWPVRMVHDFIVTEKHVVFLIPPVRIRVVKALFGIAGLTDYLQWDPDLGTEIVVIPIDEPSAMVRYKAEPFYQWHFANAFERGDDIVIDVVRYPDFRTNAWIQAFSQGRPLPEAHSSLDRVVLTPKSERFAVEPIWDHPCEFPTIARTHAGREHRYAYLAAHRDHSQVREGPLDRIAKVDVETGVATTVDFGSKTMVGEPFAVDAAAGRWLLTHVYDAESHRSSLVVLDAETMDVRARCWFGGHMPPRLHSDWM